MPVVHSGQLLELAPVDEPEDAFDGVLVSLEPDPFVEPEVDPVSDDFLSDEPVFSVEPLDDPSLPFVSTPEPAVDPLDAPSFGRESVR